MDQETWTAVDRYFNEAAVGPDTALDAAAAAAEAAQLPPVSVTPGYGKLLHLIARAQGAKRVLEIGTLGAGRDEGTKQSSARRQAKSFQNATNASGKS